MWSIGGQKTSITSYSEISIPQRSLDHITHITATDALVTTLNVRAKLLRDIKAIRSSDNDSTGF